jgi:hypothetical protein
MKSKFLSINSINSALTRYWRADHLFEKQETRLALLALNKIHEGFG